LRFDQLAAVTGGRLYHAEGAGAVFRGVSIDSRTLTRGELFVAIRGASLDGHRYIDQALQRGAAGIVAEFSYPELDGIPGTVPMVAVENSHEAMIALAVQYRHAVNARYVGITGSNGKTTTKELTWRLLQAVEPKSYRSPGNLNNLYGVPLALFGIPQDCRVAVLEMGISTEVEMPRLSEIVRPDVAVVTNVGATHLEFLGTVQAVAKAKLELVRSSAVDVPVIVNADDSILMAEVKRLSRPTVTFALDADADFRADSFEKEDSGSTRVVIEDHRFDLPLAGRHQVYNLLAAYTVCRTLGYSFDGIDTAAIELATAPMRGQIVEKAGVRFLVDCYNANPENVRAGLDGFAGITGHGRRVVVLGDMLELGEESEKFHEEVGRSLAAHRIDLAIFVGPLAARMLEAAAEAGMDRARLIHFKSAEPGAAAFAGLLQKGDLVYLKGSRGVGLELMLNRFDSFGKDA